MLLLLLVTSSATVLLLAGFAQDMLRLWRMPRLSPPDPAPPARPFVSVLIPARNEAHTIARCLDGVLFQTYPAYEVIVVDDASTDATPHILANYVRQHPQLRIVRTTGLPPGWTGKTHACQQAADAAQGAWLLFLDADTIPQPDLIAALVSHTRHQHLDMLTLFPFLELGSFWERVILPPFLAILHGTFPYERLNAPDARPEEVAANGQCIFVRRSAYTALGGHAVVRREVLEDVYLAQRLRAAGFRIGAVDGTRSIRVRMYTNGREVVDGLTKNAIAGFCSGGHRALWAGMRQFLMTLAPLWLLAAGLVLLATSSSNHAWPILLQAGLVILVALTFWATLLRHVYRLPWWHALLWLVGLHCYGLIALRALWRIRSGRGVHWKGRTYAGT